MNATNQKVEVRAFGIRPAPGVDAPQRRARHCKPTAEMSVDELRAELDRLRKKYGDGA